MSNIYIQEPPTSGKVLLKTSVGDIDIELWSREAPKACRNFVQLCMEGYYNGTIFHRLVKGFIVQGGDPEGNGSGGESIYGAPFRDEFHSRLRFARRGLVAMANSGPNDNGSQFFFTLAATPELQNKHTIFGKVTGDTVFNMLKLEEGLVDEEERPMYPHKIHRVEILHNPFEDIQPRVVVDKKVEKLEKKEKRREKGVKNFGLLSFGEEAEEDEEETMEFVKKSSGKAKSMHDAIEDPKLSRETVKVDQVDKMREKSSASESEEEIKKLPDEVDVRKTAESVRNKLKGKKNDEKSPRKSRDVDKKKAESSDSEEYDLFDEEKQRKAQRRKDAERIREEIKQVRKEYQQDKKRKIDLLDKERTVKEEKRQRSEVLEEYLSEKGKYDALKKDQPRKGASRENLPSVSKFKSKLDTAKEKRSGEASPEVEAAPATTEDDADIQGDDWLSHELHFEEKLPVLAKDAATKQDDWYDVFDPRNPLNKRRRGDKNSTTSSGRRKH
uniref:Spliceosome-associated protein CWC27 homolog n=1 Tax=Lutzomyia longipalpis TaxID=7200 RepID=A0A1B0CMB8_LUTLO